MAYLRPSFFALCLLVTSAACIGEIPGSQQPGSDARAEPDAALGPDASTAIPIACMGEVCGATVGTIAIEGFTYAEVERLVALLESLPYSIMVDADLTIERDKTETSGCPDLTRTPLLEWPEGCGWAIPEQVGEGFVLKLRNVLMDENPVRLDHVIVTFLTRMWTLDRFDEIIAHRRADWTRNCHACPADSQEPCGALDIRESTYGLVGVMTDVTAAAAATWLGASAWGGEGVRWVANSGEACTPTATQSWLGSHMFGTDPMPYQVRAIDVNAACGADASALQYQINASQPIEVNTATIGANETQIFYYDTSFSVTPPGSNTRSTSMTDGLNRVVFSGTAPFEAVVLGCP